MSFAKLIEGLLELQIFSLQSSKLLLSFVEVVQVLSDKEASEYFLNDSGLMGEITQVFFIKVFDLLLFELLSGIMGSELGLYFDGSSFLSLKLFSLEIHFEFGLYFEGSLIITFPILFGLVCTIIIELNGVLNE